MKLLDEIIVLAADDKASISGLLRKLLVLAHQLKNLRLKEWVSNELNGYEADGELPSYRVARSIAKGHFVGPLQAQINNQPLPSAALKKEHRHFAEEVRLVQPIAAYLPHYGNDGEVSNGMIEWPPNLVLMYQKTFYEGNYILNRAWQEIPASVISSLSDTVRTRVLQFTLELKDELGESTDNPSNVPAEKIEKTVNNYIFGGNNIIAHEAHEFEQTSNVTVNYNDTMDLQKALNTLGISDNDFKLLANALKEDKKENGGKTLGSKTSSWIASIGKNIGKEGLKVTASVAKAAALAWIKQHLGLY